MVLRRLEGVFLSAGDAGESAPGFLRRAVPDRRDQLDLLWDAEPEDRAVLARAKPAGICLCGEVPARDHPPGAPGQLRRVGHDLYRDDAGVGGAPRDRKSTRLNSSHVRISYAVFCL